MNEKLKVDLEICGLKITGECAREEFAAIFRPHGMLEQVEDFNHLLLARDERAIAEIQSLPRQK